MSIPVRRKASQYLRVSSLPDFLLPAFANVSTTRPFSNSSQRTSRIGMVPLSLPPEVELRLLEPPMTRSVTRNKPLRTVEVDGPLGKLAMPIPPYMDLERDDTSRKVTLRVKDLREKQQRAMWGTTRAYLQNHIIGVSEGHTAILQLVGVGFRATVESTATTVKPEYPGQQYVSLKVGYSHPIELGIPQGVKASTPQPTRILLEGIEKEVVKTFAAEIRMWRKPEPYKGKGIFVNGETIKLKAKKIK